MTDPTPTGTHAPSANEPLATISLRHLGVPEGYRVIETNRYVSLNGGTEFYYSRRKAEREADRANRARLVPSFRVEVEETARRFGLRRWKVVYYQNQLERITKEGQTSAA